MSWNDYTGLRYGHLQHPYRQVRNPGSLERYRGREPWDLRLRSIGDMPPRFHYTGSPPRDLNVNVDPMHDLADYVFGRSASVPGGYEIFEPTGEPWRPLPEPLQEFLLGAFIRLAFDAVFTTPVVAWQSTGPQSGRWVFDIPYEDYPWRRAPTREESLSASKPPFDVGDIVAAVQWITAVVGTPANNPLRQNPPEWIEREPFANAYSFLSGQWLHTSEDMRAPVFALSQLYGAVRLAVRWLGEHSGRRERSRRGIYINVLVPIAEAIDAIVAARTGQLIDSRYALSERYKIDPDLRRTTNMPAAELRAVIQEGLALYADMVPVARAQVMTVQGSPKVAKRNKRQHAAVNRVPRWEHTLPQVQAQRPQSYHEAIDAAVAQHLLPLRENRKIVLAAGNAAYPYQAEAEVYGPFGIHRPYRYGMDSAAHGWTVTHLPTGLSAGGGFRTRKIARRYVYLLLTRGMTFRSADPQSYRGTKDRYGISPLALRRGVDNDMQFARAQFRRSRQAAMKAVAGPGTQAYERFRRSLAGKQSVVLFNIPMPEQRCMQRIGPDPSWTPTWQTVPERLGAMEIDVAVACAKAAVDLAGGLLDARRGMQDPADVTVPLGQARYSLRIAQNLQYHRKSGGDVYVDPPFSIDLRRQAAVNAVLGCADVLATRWGFNDLEERFQFSPFIALGDNTDVVVYPDRSMELWHDPTRHDEIDDLRATDLARLLGDEFLGNGWGCGDVDDLGAMSSAPYITTDYTVEDDGTVHVGPLWYYNEYAVYSEIEELQATGRSRRWRPYLEVSTDRQRAYLAGTTPGHARFLDLWWRLCRCRIPGFALAPQRTTTQGVLPALPATVGSLIAREGTPYEATVRGVVPLYIIRVEAGDDSSTVHIQPAYMDQGGLAYPANHILIAGEQIVGEPSPLDEKLRDIVLNLFDVRIMEEEPARWGGHESFFRERGVQVPAPSPSFQVSRPSFFTVRRRSAHSAPYIADAVYAELRKRLMQDEFDSLHLAVSGEKGYEDRKFERGPAGELKALGEAAEIELFEGQLKGFFVEHLAAYPALRDYVLKTVIYRFPDVAPMVPSTIGVAEAKNRLVQQGYDDYAGMRSLMVALADPIRVGWIDQLDRLLSSAPDWKTGAEALDLFDILHGQLAHRETVEAVNSRNLSPAVAQTYEAAGLGGEFRALREQVGSVVEEAAEFFAQHPQEEYAPFTKWGLARASVTDLSRVLGAQLTPQATSTFESFRIAQEERKQKVALERAQARRRNSLMWPRNNAYWVRADTLDEARPLGYKEDPGRYAMNKFDEVSEEALLYEAIEDPQVQEYASAHVQPRPSQRIGDDIPFTMQDVRDLEPQDWESFFAAQGVQAPQAQQAFQRLIDQTVQRIQVDPQLRARYAQFRRPQLAQQQDAQSWRYEPDTQSMEYQREVSSKQEELAKEAALDAGYVLVEWDQPYRFGEPAPVTVTVTAHDKNLSRDQLLRLIDEIMVVNVVKDDPDAGTLVDSDRLEIEFPGVEGGYWAGTIRQYLYDRRRNVFS